jgi:hypothetical protein
MGLGFGSRCFVPFGNKIYCGQVHRLSQRRGQEDTKTQTRVSGQAHSGPDQQQLHEVHEGVRGIENYPDEPATTTSSSEDPLPLPRMHTHPSEMVPPLPQQCCGTFATGNARVHPKRFLEMTRFFWSL